MTQEEEDAAIEDSYNRIMACLGKPVLDDGANPQQSEADDGDDAEWAAQMIVLIHGNQLQMLSEDSRNQKIEAYFLSHRKALKIWTSTMVNT